MKTYYIEFVAHAANATRDEFEAHIDDIAAELVQCTGAIEADLGADLDKREVTSCMTVEAESLDAAADAVTTIARTALHAAGGATPGWESREIAYPTPDSDRNLQIA